MTKLSTRRKSISSNFLTTTLSLTNSTTTTTDKNPFTSNNPLINHEDLTNNSSLKTKSSFSNLEELSQDPIKSTTNNNVLHETILNKFNRTSNGKIYEKDLKTIFALLIISLNLNSSTTNDTTTQDSSSSSSSTFTKKLKLFPTTSSTKYPYSFHFQTAINKMENLNLEIESQNTITKISYNFKPDISKNLINRFYQAHFLHSPADRTRKEPKMGVLLQPTPKGLQIVESFCIKIGLKLDKFPLVINDSSFNSMKLFNFERDLISDKIIYSKSFLKILFIKLIGIKPNYWSPNNKPDIIINKKVSIESKNQQKSNQNFNDENLTKKFLKPISPTDHNNNNNNELTPINSSSSSSSTLSPDTNIGGFSFAKYQENKILEESNKTPTTTTKTIELKNSSLTSTEPSNITSPFYHKYFSNPESDSHIQYYVSSVGVRLIKNKIIDGSSTTTTDKKNLVLDYCINGKAIIQWLMDCTDLIQEKHALEISNLFIKEGLIKVVLVSESNHHSQDFHRDNYYRLTEKGLSISSWGRSTTETPQNPTLLPKKINSIIKQNITLDSIMKDPALKFQFKNHLVKEFCVENFDAYCQLENFFKKLQLYKELKNLSNIDPNFTKRCLNQKNICMSLSYQIFNIFINAESSCMINIDYKLRSKIINLLMNNNNNQKDDGSINDSIKYLQTPIDELKRFEKFEEFEVEGDLGEDINQDQSDIILEELEQLFKQVSDHLYKLMNIDSLPKFLNSLN
ncbi:SST2 [Candida jiufengensis]|uniref:SST2 n=1 Tax=Candida jiufengensis TaxID=497108 RepID=UPI0022257BAB|nr:SST2 [Candida jiufengensis]KAI5956320.1 SST2 [Candida jiufengensis]